MATHLRIWLLSFLIVSHSLRGIFLSENPFLVLLFEAALVTLAEAISCCWGNFTGFASIQLKKYVFLSLQIISYISPIHCSNVVQLTDDTFDKFVGKNRWISSASICIIDAGLSHIVIHGRQLQPTGVFTRISPQFSSNYSHLLLKHSSLF